MFRAHSPRFDAGPPDDARALVRELFEAHYAKLCRFAYRSVGSRALAEDLVQDVFLKVWRREQDAPTGAVTAAYLYRAVRNHTLDYLRHQRVERAWAGAIASTEIEAVEQGAEKALHAEELALAIRREVDSLPERCRLVFTLRREQELSYEEIAATLDITPKTVENHMGRALRILKMKLAAYLPVGAVVAATAEALRLVR